jgi:hypothetical protein
MPLTPRRLNLNWLKNLMACIVEKYRYKLQELSSRSSHDITAPLAPFSWVGPPVSVLVAGGLFCLWY